MASFINGVGNISPQNTFGAQAFLSELKSYSNHPLTCIEPDYSSLIDPRLLRRMSKVIRMGIGSAIQALKESNVAMPDAIITGTAFGCLEDTGTFLSKMITNQEQALNPTPFIQSTHNTIGSQVALLLQCMGYNQTYSQRAFSFENALLDALTMDTYSYQNILVGGVDEITPLSFDILKRFSVYRKNPVSSLDLFKHPAKGTLQGEGATYFLLSAQRTAETYAQVKKVVTFFHPESSDQLYSKINGFLSQLSLAASDIDVLLLGKNGDTETDANYQALAATLFPGVSTGVYKHLCGEYPTANAFALWLAARSLKEQKMPDALLSNIKPPALLKRILIYNQYLGNHHSFILVEAS